jgi:hypothetical protein
MMLCIPNWKLKMKRYEFQMENLNLLLRMKRYEFHKI